MIRYEQAGFQRGLSMGEKSAHKKQFIVETARQVFVEKGYKDVTMKDIVDACGISRGGLYLYFESTAELFREVLEAEQKEKDDIFSGEIPEDATATDILLVFLKEQKKEILLKKNSITVAAYEYFFSNKPAKKDNLLRRKFLESVDILKGLIEAGVENGEFVCEDPESTAQDIMFVLEGLRVCSQTMGLSESRVDRELLYIMEGLVYEDL